MIECGGSGPSGEQMPQWWGFGEVCGAEKREMEYRKE